MSLPSEQAQSPQELMFAEAMAAIDAGDRAHARDLLTRLLKTGQASPEYWVWMSAVVETQKERTFCLREALRLDPANVTATRGLVLLGVTPPDASQVVPARLQKRNWQSKFSVGDEETIKKVAGPSKVQIAMMAVALLAVVGLIAFAFLGMQKQFQTQRRRAPVINLPTFTAVAAVEVTPTEVTPVPEGSPVPLWMQLQATYTPTALYVNTPHAASEAYRVGIRYFQRGDWENARQQFIQVTAMEPEAADALYYIGESYRQEGNLEKALETFEGAIEKSPDFAPLYLGRARTLAQQDPKQIDDAIADAELAIRKDRGYGEAYLELGMLQLQAKDYPAAQDALNQAAEYLPESPLVYLTRARVNLAKGEYDLALQNARRANQLDITLIVAYRVMGEVLQAEGDVAGSLQPLNTYIQYEQNDPLAWVLIAKAYLADKDYDQAQEAAELALSLNKMLAEAYLVRAETYLESRDGQKAWSDYRTVQGLNANSFEANLGIGKALMLLEYPGDAYMQFERTKAMAEEESQKAELLYWRALSLDELGENAAALRDWRSLLEMPEEVVLPEWAAYAEKRITALVTATPTTRPKTSTPTVKPTRTRQPTFTPTPTVTRRPTLTRTPTATPRPSLTPTR